VEHYVDHELKRVADPMDATATNYIAENEMGDIIGCCRVNYSRDGNLGDYPEFYEIDTDTPHYLKDVCIYTRYSVLPEYRSSFLPMQIMRKFYKDALEDGQVAEVRLLSNQHNVDRFLCTRLWSRTYGSTRASHVRKRRSPTL
jgi:hypothetical protein